MNIAVSGGYTYCVACFVFCVHFTEKTAFVEATVGGVDTGEQGGL
jgi:hypothetical protein